LVKYNRHKDYSRLDDANQGAEMYELEIYAKYREREMRENLKRSRYKRLQPRKPNWLVQLLGNTLTYLGDFLSRIGYKLLKESSDTEIRPSPEPLR
jgi:hypothetical protein